MNLDGALPSVCHCRVGSVSGVRCLAFVLVLAGTAGAQVTLQANSARDCAICHLNWVDSFKRPGAILLMEPPAQPVVAESDTCLGCHDGAVGDDRRRVWLEHGHVTGVKPPPGMKVPPNLPLKNGEVACRTCHTAHSGQGPETLATTVFIRVHNNASQLCVACHPEKTKGPELGTHPVGGMPFPVPEALLAAGAHQGPDPQRLICQTCHTPHGSAANDLLVMGTQSSQLCLTCHTKVRPALWRPDTGREHPQNPPLSSDAQRQAIKEMGTKVGEGDTLICLSCHKLHHGLAGRYMLADTLKDSNLCVQCHPYRKEMFGSLHDLRVSRPEEQNRLGQNPEQSGPCGACHSFHQFARRPDPEPLDPTGLCATCHQPGQCAGQKSGLPFSHPTDIQQKIPAAADQLTFLGQPDDPLKRGFACLTCHDPHKTQERHFLRMQPTAICATCHGDKVATLAPQHNFTGQPSLVNARGENAAQAGQCGFCHGTHNAVGPAMWVATKQAPQTPNAWCTECHSPQGLAKAHAPPLRHPSGPDTTMKAHGPGSNLPLFDAQGRHTAGGFVACSTCHDPHGGVPGGSALLRVSQTGGHAGLCAQCHSEAESIHLSLHKPEVLSQHFKGAEYCAPCHAVHERPGMPAGGMWAAPLGPQTQSAAVRQCTGCHSLGGGATPITPTIHPAVTMHAVGEPESDSYLPLFNDSGEIDPAGSVACATCHVPHGRRDAQALAGGKSATAAPEQLSSLRIMVRPYVTPNVCSSCHGFDGIRRYLYYHDPQRRSGPAFEAKP